MREGLLLLEEIGHVERRDTTAKKFGMKRAEIRAESFAQKNCSGCMGTSVWFCIM